MKDDIGRFAVCTAGRIGRVTKIERTTDARRLYVGVGLDGSPWQSTQPRFIADADVAIIREALRLGGTSGV